MATTDPDKAITNLLTFIVAFVFLCSLSGFCMWVSGIKLFTWQAGVWWAVTFVLSIIFIGNGMEKLDR